MLDVFQLMALRVDEELETILFHKERQVMSMKFISNGKELRDEDGNVVYTFVPPSKTVCPKLGISIAAKTPSDAQ